MRRLALALSLLASPAAAALAVVPVAPDVWALVGPKEQRSPTNFANNATFGLVVTAEGAALIDPGGSWKGAEEIHAAVRSITDAPVVLVIDTGGQDHRWLGNGYWAAQGARIVASAAAVEDQRARASAQLSALDALIGDALDGTIPVHAAETFERALTIRLGGLTFEIVHPGPAHTPGDSFVRVPERDVVFTGDIVYLERIPGVMDHSHAGAWIEAFDAMAAFAPTHVVPGHGVPADLARARADTRDYLAHLRARIAEHIAAGGDAIGAADVDQSAFAHLEQFDALARRNAQQVFTEMEWE